MAPLEALRRDGAAAAGRFEGWRQFINHLRTRPVYDAHVRAKAKLTASVPAAIAMGWPMFCHDMADVIAAPGWFEEALSHIDIAREYFGEEPVLYSLNAFWTQPSAQTYQYTHGWHREGDDRKQLVMFLFGTDVDMTTGGAHLYQTGTHKIADADLGRDFREPPPSGIMVIYGQAGKMFFADTSGLHVGLRPTKIPRLLAWARWGVSDPPESYVHDQLAPVPAASLGDRYPEDPVLRRAIRLVAV